MISLERNRASYPTALRCITMASVAAIALGAWLPHAASAQPCVVHDNGSGTVTLPPIGCEYLSPTQVHEIIANLPAGTTIELAPIHLDFICSRGGADSFPGCPPPGLCEDVGGGLGGNVDCFDSTLQLAMTGTGALAGFNRNIAIPLMCQVYTGPRMPPDPVQTFQTEMFMCQGGIFGDPDFDQLNILVGPPFGLPPSPGSTTLTQLGGPGSDWAVDSFFDITYQIDFVGAPGSVLEGFSGPTQGTLHMVASGVPGTTCPLANPGCDAFLAGCVGTGNELCYPDAFRGTNTGAVIDGCACAVAGDCGPVDVVTDPLSGQILSFNCSGACPIAGNTCEIAVNGNRLGVSSISAIEVQAGQVVTCECPQPPPDPHRTVNPTNLNFGAGDVPPIPADFFGPGSDPFFGTVPMQGGSIDTLIQRAKAVNCPGLGACPPIPIEIVQLDLVSVAPITVTFNGGTLPETWDVEVTLSGTGSGQGSMQPNKTHANGGTYDAQLPVLPKLTFTSVANPTDVRVIDYGVTGQLPIELNFLGIPWVVNLAPQLQGTIAAPSDGNFVPAVDEVIPGDPTSQVVVDAAGFSKGGGVSHTVRPVELCALSDPTGGADICAPLQQRDCIGSPNSFCLPTRVQVNAVGSVDAVECACATPGASCGPVSVDPVNGVISCPGTCVAPDVPPCQLYQVDPNGAASPTGLTSAPADLFPPGTVLYCGCAPPVERCCLSDGTCQMLAPADCRLLNGAPGGAGSACAGVDLDQNGRDDACEFDTKCSQCLPGLHWVDVCPAGLDHIPTGALVGVDLDGDCVQDVSVVLSGPAWVSRVAGVPHQIIPTEIVAMNLTGGGMSLVAGGGGGIGGNLAPTFGKIIEQNADPTSADSSFDVMFELSGGPLPGPVYNQTPLTVLTKIQCLPPTGNYLHPVGICIPLFDSPIVGAGNVVANLVSANHQTYPGCVKDSDCPNKCEFCDTTTFTCATLPPDVCCVTDADCVGFGTKCSIGLCDPATNACVTGPPIPGCCVTDADCSAFATKCRPGLCDPTTNQCVTGPPAAGCCESDADCPSKCDVCDVATNQCVQADPNCCQTDADCSSFATKCRPGLCDSATNLCVTGPPVPGCCESDLDCDDGNACTRNVCDLATNSCLTTPICEACCMNDGTCTNLALGECGPAGGHVVPACLGDANGNGIDDACENAKCSNCGAGPHWIDTCPPVSPDSDTIPTGALLGIDLNMDCVADTSLVLGGITTIGKQGPLDDSANFPGTRPVDGHLDVVDTEILWASMTGGGVQLDIGTGLGLNPTLGSVAELPFDPSTAESRFEVLARLQGGALPGPVYNWTPISVREDITCLPPNGRYIHFGGCTPLYPVPNPTLGVLPVANLVQAVHFTFPDCCLPDGVQGKSCSCQSLPPAECKALGGVPANCLGDANGDGCDDACNPPTDFCPDPSVEDWCAPFQATECIPTAPDVQACLPTGVIWDPAVGPRATGCACFSEGPECGPVNIRRVTDAAGNVETYFDCQGVCTDGTDNCLVHFRDPLTGAETNTGLHVVLAPTVPAGAEVICKCPPNNVCRPNADRTGCEPVVCPDPTLTCRPTKLEVVGACLTAPISCVQDSDCPAGVCVTTEEVAACDCVPDIPPPSSCRWELNAATGLHDCVGDCDDGTPCRVTTQTAADGTTQFVCDCAEPSACVPNATGTACEPFVCPGPLPPLDTCVASCVDVDPITGAVRITACDCRGLTECRAQVGPVVGGRSSTPGAIEMGTGGNPCVVPDNGNGTVTLPPPGCAYLSPDQVHEIIDGLPAGVTVEFAAIHKDFICLRQPGADPGFCPADLPPGLCEEEGGDLGGNVECGTSRAELTVFINGVAGRALPHLVTIDGIQHLFHSGPHGGGADVQSFDTEMVAMQGEALPDAVFSQFRIKAGRMFGLPSPGHTTLRRLPSGDFTVDSFFDVFYEIDYVGTPGGPLDGAAGVSRGTVRMSTGSVPLCEGACPNSTFDQCVQTSTTIQNPDGTVTIHACCDCGCPPSSTPTPVRILDTAGVGHDLTANRFLIFKAGDPGRNQAIRVTLKNLAPPYDIWNGKQLYVGRPGLVSNAGASVLPNGQFPSFTAAQLQCQPLCRNDWSALGELHVFHEAIVPGSVYDIDVVDCSCDLADKSNYSPPLTLSTSDLGDTLEDMSIVPPGPPDGGKNVVDVLGVLASFASAPTAPRKARSDIEPNCLDLLINVTDALQTLTGFSGGSYSFPPKTDDPCLSPCSNPVP